ncbi:MAG: LysR family transcriptional regulator [Acidimicrobiales bacterium]
MDSHQLSILVAVADQGSFSAAADALDTVQSNVSAHVARLERELGVVLVDRGARCLTDEGKAVVARARRVAAEMEAVVTDLAALRHEVVGTVRIGLIGTTARWLLPHLIERVARRHPKLHLEAVEGTSTSLEPQVVSGWLDLAVVNLPVAGAHVAFSPLFEEDLVLVVSASDPLANRGDLELADLRPLRLLLPMTGTALRHEIDSVLGPAGVRPSLAAEVDGVRLLASLTFEGLGPAILPATSVPAFMRGEWSLVRVRGLPRRRVGVIRRLRAFPQAPARALSLLLEEVVTRTGALPEGLYPARPARIDPSRE